VLAFIARRLMALIPLVLLVTLASFGLVLLLPGDAVTVIAGQDATPAQQDHIREQLGLDEPFVARYLDWLGGAVRGDFGHSLIFSTRSVGGEIVNRFPVTLSLAGGAVALGALLGASAGIAAGLRPGRTVDRVVSVLTSVAIGLPSYVIALVLVIVCAVQLGVLPSRGYVAFGEDPWQWFRHLLLPWIALGLPASASIARQVRGALVDVMDEDYIRTARAKGLAPARVVGKHALKNAAMPALTVLGIQFAYLLGGTVIIEQIFSIEGLGRMITRAISSRDVPVIQGVTFLMACIFLVVNLLVDIAYALVNPKVRLE
jgi:peptide/nickel transport system permease protein